MSSRQNGNQTKAVSAGRTNKVCAAKAMKLRFELSLEGEVAQLEGCDSLWAELNDIQAIYTVKQAIVALSM